MDKKRTFKTNLKPKSAPVPVSKAKPTNSSQGIKSTSYRLPAQDLQDLKKLTEELKKMVSIPINQTMVLRVLIKAGTNISKDRLVKALKDLI